jgi:glutamine transport system permease protein
MDFDPALLWESLPDLLRGARITVALTIVSVLLGLMFGVVGGLCRVAPIRAVRLVASG